MPPPRTPLITARASSVPIAVCAARCSVHQHAQPYFQAGLGLRIFTEPDAPAGRTWTNLPFCHWKINVVAAPLRPSESNLTGPWTECSVTPLCRYWMILELTRPFVAATACCATCPTEYASATSALIPDGVPW